MRTCIVAAALALALAGCGSSADEAGDDGEAPASAGVAVERCTERLLSDAELVELTAEEQEAVRSYTESTYCARFADRGWVYDDGALSIDAYTSLAEGGEEECAEAETERTPGEGPAGSGQTVPCDEVDAGEDETIDCALLRHVRRSEVRAYLDELEERGRSVECDDGTPLADLGAR